MNPSNPVFISPSAIHLLPHLLCSSLPPSPLHPPLPQSLLKASCVMSRCGRLEGPRGVDGPGARTEECLELELVWGVWLGGRGLGGVCVVRVCEYRRVFPLLSLQA